MLRACTGTVLLHQKLHNHSIRNFNWDSHEYCVIGTFGYQAVALHQLSPKYNRVAGAPARRRRRLITTGLQVSEMCSNYY